MNRFFRRTLSLFLSASLACSLGISAAASNALGEDLSSRDTLLNQETQLSTNVFWSSADVYKRQALGSLLVHSIRRAGRVRRDENGIAPVHRAAGDRQHIFGGFQDDLRVHIHTGTQSFSLVDPDRDGIGGDAAGGGSCHGDLGDHTGIGGCLLYTSRCV